MVRVENPTIEPYQRILDRHDGSPALRFESVRDGAADLALICEDPDAPRDGSFVHWVLCGLPADLSDLDEATRTGTPGTNDWCEQAYGGSERPPGHGTHCYHFRIYALDAPLDLARGRCEQAATGWCSANSRTARSRW